MLAQMKLKSVSGGTLERLNWKDMNWWLENEIFVPL